jgi:hypothetical protein
MSVVTLHEVLCDSPGCTASIIYRGLACQLPDEWTVLRSTAHITGPHGKGRRKISESDRCYGSFSLELCPAHPNAFDGHRPRTDGWPGNRRDEGGTSVSCECGDSLGWTRAVYLIGARSDGPRHAPELKWWRHLPVELRAYALRAVSG